MLAHKHGLPANSEPEVPHFYLWLNGEARQGMSAVLDVTSPYDGMLVGTVSVAGRRQVREALAGSEKAYKQLKVMSRYQRAELLFKVVERLNDARTELVDALILEGGKPRMFAEQEFERTITTFSWAAEEAKRFCGEQIPLDGMARGEGYEGYTRREPIGTIAAITPFNFPLNLVAHKVAPALATGNPVLLKPASATPISALILARIISEAGFPAGSVNAMPIRHQDIPLLLKSDSIRMLSFTGSPETGWALKQLAKKQRVVLELGGNSGSFVDQNADLDRAARQLALGGFAHAGQSCIAVQRIYVHKKVYEPFLKKLIENTQATKAGNPQDGDTITGPVITPESADRIIAWIGEAVTSGANIACGGERLKPGRGLVIQPTVLTEVKDSMLVCCKEIFGPVVTVAPVEDAQEAIRRINRSEYGLQAAVFSHDLRTIQHAIEALEVGGVVINDFPTYRVDHMPYGGTKNSGLGREGIRSAMLEMTGEKMVITRKSVG
ncbi:MAG: aldehyde dehydrogenase family protein [Mariprofundaceae bacterium]|nr:aldehyde dehydrogenase family protein [Mariprofundaceae bacterium]